jgi:vacuolar-type H+-ATPase subunit D/Vma8
MENKTELTKEEVIQSSDKLYKSSEKWIEHVEYTPINEYEKKMLEGTLKPEELIEKEKEEKPIEVDWKKQHIMKVKVIGLDKMGKPPLSNPSLFKKKEKDELIKHMEEILKLPEDEITLLFNAICNEKIFTTIADYSVFPMN